MIICGIRTVETGYKNTYGSKKFVLITGINYTVVVRTVFQEIIPIRSTVPQIKRCITYLECQI